MNSIDIKQFSSDLHESMRSQIDIIGQENQELVARSSKSIVVIKSCLKKLKDFVSDYQFQSKEEEIEFFKRIKPVFASQFHYHDMLFNIKVNEPFGTADTLRTYYVRELGQLNELVKSNQEFYRYYLSNSTNLDDQYFTRQGNCFDGLDVDSKSSTGYDNKLSIILAIQMVKEYLLCRVKNLPSELLAASPSSLTWTGPKTALIELIYALQKIEVINNGKADIRQIASSFESLFNVSLGNYYKQFQEIRLRKNGKTNFMDELKTKLVQRMDDFDH